MGIRDRDLDELLGAKALVRADRRAKRHDAGRARVGQIPGGVQVGIHVGHDDISLFCQDLRRLDGLVVVRQQVFGVVDHFNFDKVAAAQFPREMGNACLLYTSRCV